jgi:hypothetical protein
MVQSGVPAYVIVSDEEMLKLVEPLRAHLACCAAMGVPEKRQ